MLPPSIKSLTSLAIAMSYGLSGRAAPLQEGTAETAPGATYNPAMPIVSIPSIPDVMKGVSFPIEQDRRRDSAAPQGGKAPLRKRTSPRRCQRPQESIAQPSLMNDGITLQGNQVQTQAALPSKAPSSSKTQVQAQATTSESSLAAVAVQEQSTDRPSAASLASASAPVAQTSKSAGGSGGYDLSRKAGIAINGPAISGNSLQDAVSNTDASWGYVWAVEKPPNFPSGLDFVPMLHDMGQLDKFNAVDWAGKGYKYAMTLNEPNHASGAVMEATEAASKMKALSVPSSVKLGAPSLANEGTKSAADWFSDYKTAGGPSDFLPVHYYGDQSDGMIAFLKDMVTKFPDTDLWVTEYACQTWDSAGHSKLCPTDKAAAFHEAVIKYMKGEDHIKRYSAEGLWKPSANPNNGNELMNESGQLTPLGQSVLT